MNDAFRNPFNEEFQGIVTAAGILVVKFGPPYNNSWTVEQVTLEMPNAPVGATAEIRRMGAFIDRAQSARKASAAQEPPIFLNGGETMTVEWAGCTPGQAGKVLAIYRKGLY